MAVLPSVEKVARRSLKAGPPLLAYFGHHKCASTWIADIVFDVCSVAGLRAASVHNPRGFGGDLAGFVEARPIDFLLYVNANWEYASPMRDFIGFHVIRDPRDIIVSSYFSHLHSHPTDDWPELVEHRKELQGVDEEEGILVVLDFLSDVLDDIGSWHYGDPRVIELKMEDVVRSPEVIFQRVFGALGVMDPSMGRARASLVTALAEAKRRRRRAVPVRLVPLPAAVVEDAVRRHAFEKKAGGRRPGSEDVRSHYRKGVLGDWVNHFTPKHRRVFKERYGELLVRLGYEMGPDW
jgi:hypothetical protein